MGDQFKEVKLEDGCGRPIYSNNVRCMQLPTRSSFLSEILVEPVMRIKCGTLTYNGKLDPNDYLYDYDIRID